jgi:1-aminocyclopropane-1-carboxylate deaminase/D-cysteine desulfhydrase-like pyridoxal-dependent ACC family enzyme
MSNLVTESELRSRLAKLPRLRLAALPTPLDEAPRLAEELGGPRILVKRDDLTGVAFGGNKLREFEYSLAPAVNGGYDVLVNSGGAQSNHSRLTAAVAARLGMRAIIIARADSHAQPAQGNLLLCHLFGAEVHLVNPQRPRQEADGLMRRLWAEGHRPYHTGSNGAVYRSAAYVDGFLELWGQLEERGVVADAIYICSGRHAQVGLVVAAGALGIDVRIVGIPFSPRLDDLKKRRQLANEANDTAALLGLNVRFGFKDMETHVKFAGPGHGVLTKAAREAIHLAARTEGLVLDPIYTAKAMACLVAHIRAGMFSRDQTVVFVHTGGTPGLFAYNTELGLDV